MQLHITMQRFHKCFHAENTNIFFLIPGSKHALTAPSALEQGEMKAPIQLTQIRGSSIM